MRRALPADRFAGLDDPAQGLSSAEVRARRARFGGNEILPATGVAWFELLVATLRDPMPWFLLGTSGLYGLLGELREAFVLLLALLPFLLMDAFLHRRTQASVAGLAGQLAGRARVLRDGVAQDVAAADLVPGDLVEIAAGASVPADAVLVEATALQVDEAVVTGESLPVRKRPLDSPPGRPGPPRDDAVWLLAVIRLLQGHGWVDALLGAVTLAVAALPEEFPIVFTFFLGMGVHRLARRRALVRRAVVVESIGRVGVVCTDKTGTLTEGRLAVVGRLPEPGVDEVRLLRLAAAASRPDGGDPFDAAILAAAGAAPQAVIERFPFTEDRRRETAILRADDAARAGDELLVAVKGAPETIIAMCTLDEADRADRARRVETLAEAGHRVVACAFRSLDARAWAGGEPDRGFRLAGLIAVADPLRAGVSEAIAACAAAGIHVLVVTGDHAGTAAAVARAIGLGAGRPVVAQADAIERAARDDPGILLRTDVIARALPAQKLAFVRALQGLGEVVAVTGDGVNDVPALQAADIGIAMGERGSRSAREVASIVLLDDDFATIVRAIGEGQQLFADLRRCFAFLLTIHIPFVLSAALIPLAGWPLLYLPVHVVWLELVIHPTALLAFQGGAGAAVPVPRHASRALRFFAPGEWIAIGGAGGIATVLLIAGYHWSLGMGREIDHARAMVMVMLSCASAAIAAVLSGLRGRAPRLIVAATLLAAVVLVQTPPLAAWLHLRPLHGDDWLLAAAAGLLVAALPAVRWLPGTLRAPGPAAAATVALRH